MTIWPSTPCEKGSLVHQNHTSGIFPVLNEIATMFLRVLAQPAHTVGYNSVDYFLLFGGLKLQWNNAAF